MQLQRIATLSTVTQRLTANIRLPPTPPSLLIVPVGIRISSVKVPERLLLRKLASYLCVRVFTECLAYRRISRREGSADVGKLRIQEF